MVTTVTQYPDIKISTTDTGTTSSGHTWYETKSSDNHVSGRDLEQSIPWRTSLTIISNLFQNDILIEIDTIKSINSRKLRDRGQRMPEFTYAISRRNQHIDVPIKSFKCRHSEKYCMNSR